MSNKQFFTHISGMDKSYRDVNIKHAGIIKTASIKRMANEAGIIHDLKANVEIIKKGVKQITPVDLVNVSRKE